MQKRHADRQLYFNEQSITTQKYVIPFIEKHKPITADSHILEIGCGEGGNIKPFLDLGCQVTGIDINGGQIAIAKEIYSVHPNNRNLTLICEDIYKVTELHNKFDIIIIRDVIEHIPNQELFLPFIKRFLSPHGIIFVAFPPWQNPFGGHQQICNNKLLSHLPWFHLLPRPVYKKVLEWGNVNPGGLLEIKDTGISLERFLSIVHKEKYRIVEEVLYFINPNYFEGTSNRLVRSSSEAIAQEPGKTFNPMFVFGASGVGKTHLCHAIGNRIQEIHPEKKVLYISAHLFTVQYTEAIRKNTTNDFMYFYQGVDVLILDDIQELIGKDKTQNTFFHIFNHLHLLGKQLILTSDKAPVDLQGMEERLITRLKWGLTAELDRPDLDLRKKILKNKISHDGVVIPDDVFNFIASNVTENVRDVEGIVASLLAYSTAFNRMIDLPLTKQVVSRVVKLEKKQVSVESIQDVVCKYYNLELAAIQTNSRKREIVQARQVTMYLAKKYTDSSFSHIGKIVGKRDHATVLHACKTVRDQIETNKSFRSSVEEIEALLKA